MANFRERIPHVTLVVAGDRIQDLGGRHYYGTPRCHALLNVTLAQAQLTRLTTTDRFDPGVLDHPPIDHICAGSGLDGSITTGVHGWNKDVDGVGLSDHGGTLANLTIEPGRTGT